MKLKNRIVKELINTFLPKLALERIIIYAINK